MILTKCPLIGGYFDHDSNLRHLKRMYHKCSQSGKEEKEGRLVGDFYSVPSFYQSTMKYNTQVQGEQFRFDLKNLLKRSYFPLNIPKNYKNPTKERKPIIQIPVKELDGEEKRKKLQKDCDKYHYSLFYLKECNTNQFLRKNKWSKEYLSQIKKIRPSKEIRVLKRIAKKRRVERRRRKREKKAAKRKKRELIYQSAQFKAFDKKMRDIRSFQFNVLTGQCKKEEIGSFFGWDDAYVEELSKYECILKDKRIDKKCLELHQKNYPSTVQEHNVSMENENETKDTKTNLESQQIEKTPKIIEIQKEELELPKEEEKEQISILTEEDDANSLLDLIESFDDSNGIPKTPQKYTKEKKDEKDDIDKIYDLLDRLENDSTLKDEKAEKEEEAEKEADKEEEEEEGEDEIIIEIKKDDSDDDSDDNQENGDNKKNEENEDDSQSKDDSQGNDQYDGQDDDQGDDQDDDSNDNNNQNNYRNNAMNNAYSSFNLSRDSLSDSSEDPDISNMDEDQKKDFIRKEKIKIRRRLFPPGANNPSEKMIQFHINFIIQDMLNTKEKTEEDKRKEEKCEREVDEILKRPLSDEDEEDED